MRYKSFTLTIYGLLFIFTMFGCSQRHYPLGGTKHTSAAWHKATMKSYTVLGKCYHPTYVSLSQVQHGISSWYGPNFHGKYTSNGEVYNMYAHTAAHKTWPMDTMVKVTNKQNAKSTIVRINDRGPFVKGRIIDCSYAAGKALGLDKMGIAKVTLKVVGFSGKLYTPKKNRAKDTTKDRKTRIALSNFGLQLSSFYEYKAAQVSKAKYEKVYAQHKPIIKKLVDVNGIILYRVWLMGFCSEYEAREFKNKNALMGAFIVRN